MSGSEAESEGDGVSEVGAGSDGGSVDAAGNKAESVGDASSSAGGVTDGEDRDVGGGVSDSDGAGVGIDAGRVVVDSDGEAVAAGDGSSAGEADGGLGVDWNVDGSIALGVAEVDASTRPAGWPALEN